MLEKDSWITPYHRCFWVVQSKWPRGKSNRRKSHSKSQETWAPKNATRIFTLGNSPSQMLFLHLTEELMTMFYSHWTQWLWGKSLRHGWGIYILTSVLPQQTFNSTPYSWTAHCDSVFAMPYLSLLLETMNQALSLLICSRENDLGRENAQRMMAQSERVRPQCQSHCWPQAPRHKGCFILFKWMLARRKPDEPGACGREVLLLIRSTIVLCCKCSSDFSLQRWQIWKVLYPCCAGWLPTR